LAGFEAACEALYPENDVGAPTWRDTDMVARAGVLWDELPPEARLTLEAFFAGLELGGTALAPGLGRLSALAPARRLAMFNRMRRSRIWPLRVLAETVKSTTTMVYLSHPLALRYLGVGHARVGSAGETQGAPAPGCAVKDVPLPRPDGSEEAS